MKGTMSYCYILYGCTIVVTVVNHALGHAVMESTNEAIKRQSLKCNNHCPFDFVPDVEGDRTCRCFNPCLMLWCDSGRKCEPEMPSHCAWTQCEAIARCVVTAMKVPKGYGFIPSYREIPLDAPYTGGHGGNDVSVCSEPVLPEALSCKHKQRRWFYNVMSGRCERFYGCITGGNNFIRKRSCKDTCKDYVIPPSELKAILPDDDACARAPSYKDFTSCDTKRRRWFYNEKTGLCEKFTGCEGSGNNFARKVFCKAKCRNMIMKFRKSRSAGSRSKAERPR